MSYNTEVRTRWLSNLIMDARHAWRAIRNTPRVAFLACTSIGIGAGLAAIVVSVYQCLVLGAVPFPERDALVSVKYMRRDLRTFSPMSLPAARLMDDGGGGVFASVGYHATPQVMMAETPAGAEAFPVVRVSANWFGTLGMPAEHGRYVSAVDWPSHAPVAVLSNSLWKHSYGGTPTVIGRSIRLDGRIYTVIGVMPERFTFPEPFVRAWVADFGDPLPPADLHHLHNRTVVARLGHGVTATQAKAALAPVATALESADAAEYRDIDLSVVPLIDDVVTTTKPILRLMLAAAIAVLTISSVNLGGLLLVHYAARQHTIALRLALGATRRRVLQFLLVESLCLAGIGSVCAIAIAAAGAALVRAFGPTGITRLETLSLDGYAVLSAIGLSYATAIAAAAVPAIRGTTRVASNAVIGGPRPAQGRVTHAWLQRGFCSAQIAAAISLSIVAGLLTVSLYELQRVPLGFLPSNLIVVSFASGDGGDAATRIADEFISRASTFPQVSHAAITDVPPLTGAFAVRPFRFQTSLHEWKTTPFFPFRSVGPEFFRTMAIPIVAGREFSADDRRGSACILMVNQSAQRALWPGRSGVGETIDLNDADNKPYPCTVVGVAGDARLDNPSQPPGPQVFFPYVLFHSSNPFVVVRSTSDADAIRPSLLAAALQLANSPHGTNAWELDRSLRGTWRDARFRALFLSLVAAVAVLLAVLGVYGISDYSARRRLPEIGVRVALGASRRQILGMLMRGVMVTSVIGVIGGLVGFALLRNIVRAFLFDTRVSNPGVLVSIPLLVLSIALIASLIPAWRALDAGPQSLLRR